MNTKQLADLHRKFHKLIGWLVDHGFHDESAWGRLLYVRRDAIYERRVYFDWNSSQVTRETILIEPFKRGYGDYMSLLWENNPYKIGTLEWSSYEEGQSQADSMVDTQIHDPER